MVWEQDVKGIIMLTLFVEKNTAKCEVYFPNLEDLNQNNEKLTFGRFELNFISEEPLKGYTIRQIELENLDVSTYNMTFRRSHRFLRHAFSLDCCFS